MPIFSLLALKILKEIEVTDRRTTRVLNHDFNPLALKMREEVEVTYKQTTYLTPPTPSVYILVGLLLSYFRKENR